MITITGGKLTTYRVMAADVVDAAEKVLGRRRTRPVPTATLPLPGGAIASLDTEVAEAGRVAGAADVARQLVEAHGDAWRSVWSLAESFAGGRERLVPELPWIRAELAWALEQEMAVTLGDLLIRRTHVAFETRDQGRTVAREVSKWIAPLAGWDERRVADELGRYDAEVTRIFG